MGRGSRSTSFTKGMLGSSGSSSGGRRPRASFWAGVGVSAEVMVAGLALTVLYQVRRDDGLVELNVGVRGAVWIVFH